MDSTLKYKFSHYAIGLSGLIAVIFSYAFVWKNGGVNFIDGDTEYYYYYLQSTFVNQNLIHYEWLTDANGLHHHPVGLSLLLLPFFSLAYLYARLFDFPVDGFSAPFQVAISLAAITFLIVGLNFLKKLLRLNGISDRVAALTILLVFAGTNLFHYSVIEPAMSHVYSFCLIAVFLYHSCRYVLLRQNRNLLLATLALGFILLLRPNNVFIVFSLLFWFNSKHSAITFFKGLVRNKIFYLGIALLFVFGLLQLLTWHVKENSLYSNRYAGFGFHWLKPHLLQMLFGFDAGFFIYTPLCFIFLLGLIPLFKQNRYAFYSYIFFFFILFYFLASYSAYTYFDGLGIRVLVDFYALFALLGAKLFMLVESKNLVFGTLLLFSMLFSYISLVYSYQEHHNILLRAGMTYNKWKYIFLKTGPDYQNCLGGANDLTPYADKEPAAALEKQASMLAEPFDYTKKDFGVVVAFDSIGFNSNQVHLKINCSRKELVQNASKNAMICASFEDRLEHKNKAYAQFLLNETPATNCCEEKEYAYSCTMHGDFKTNDRLSVYIWNIDRQPFLVSEFSVHVYNYNYQIN